MTRELKNFSLFAYSILFFSYSLPAAYHKHIWEGSNPFYTPVGKILTRSNSATGTVMTTRNGNPFILTAKHAIIPGEDIYFNSGQTHYKISSVLTPFSPSVDLAVLFPESSIENNQLLLSSAIPIHRASPIFPVDVSGISTVYTNQINEFQSTLSSIKILGTYQDLSIPYYAAGFGAPVISFSRDFGLLDATSVGHYRSAFKLQFDFLKSVDFHYFNFNRLLGLNLKSQHTLYFKGNFENGNDFRNSSPGFSGSPVFGYYGEPIGIITASTNLNSIFPNKYLLFNLLRQNFGTYFFPWNSFSYYEYPFRRHVIYKHQNTIVEPLFPHKENIELTVDIHYENHSKDEN
ncbi:hypothetical protein Bealeia1_00953 [Candidatus Bealeia paramacronuclearis]|uniref:Serine protease n=1 Tax=Candidatus Bealeia paramacronuclearis TaxID=1921001 RepID=A0ABZ2C3Y8_9PROT|nr:hypothetical protein [Candidatus Bealeia paramacronuclearis]